MAGLSGILDAIRGKHRQQLQDVHSRFLGLVADLAAGKEPDADVAAKILRDAVKTPEDLSKEVANLENRNALKNRVKQKESLEAELGRVEKQIGKLEKAFLDAREEHQRTMIPVLNRRDSIMVELGTISAAMDELTRTCPDESLRDALKALTAEDAALESLRRDLTRRVGILKTEVANVTARGEQAARTHGEGFKEEAEACEQRAKELNGRLRELTTEVASLDERRLAIIAEREKVQRNMAQA